MSDEARPVDPDPPREPDPGPAPLSRRELLAGAGTVALAALAPSAFPPEPPVLPRTPPPLPDLGGGKVAVVACGTYQEPELSAALARAMELVPPPPVQGKRVVLKPNFVEYHPERPVTTRVELLRATVRLFRDLGAREVVVAEGPGHRRDSDEVWFRSGLLEAADKDGFRAVDLNVDRLVKAGFRPLPDPGGLGKSRLAELWLPRTVVEADLLVSMPKLKTHHWAGMTLSMKNLFGVLPGAKYGWPKNLLHYNGIPRSILELAMNVPVGYSIVDGIVGMEGDGPIMGTAVASGVLLVGETVGGVDRVGAELIGLSPDRMEAFELAGRAGLPISAPSEQRGEPVGALRREYRMLPMFDSLRG